MTTAKVIASALTESTLSRVWQITSDPNRPFAVLTAFRSEYSREENLERNAQLGADLRNLGYGFWVLEGHWIENRDTPREVDAAEDVYFVSSKRQSPQFVYDILMLTSKYDQEAALVKSVDNVVRVCCPDSSSTEVPNFRPEMLGKAYSKIRRYHGNGRTFVFESARSAGGWAAHIK